MNIWRLISYSVYDRTAITHYLFKIWLITFLYTLTPTSLPINPEILAAYQRFNNLIKAAAKESNTKIMVT